MKIKPVAIVLGGTIPHKFLIENLRGRGFETILVDYYENPPAASSADKHIRESTLDQDAILDIAKHEKASLVISGCVDQANVTACYVAEKLNLPAPYSYETALRVTDKALMKAGMVDAGVPTARYEVISADQINDLISADYPKVVKPCDCNGSKGVRKVTDQDALKKALVEACQLSRTAKAIIEDFNPGLEVNGYYLIGHGKALELYIKSKRLPEGFGQASLQSFMSIGPADISTKARDRLRQAAENIASGFGLENTPLLVQAMFMGMRSR